MSRASLKQPLLLAAFTAAFATPALLYSHHHGRLSVPPDWDDVKYMTYAAKRLSELHTTGLLSCLQGFLRNPLHSPYSCLLAFFSFLLLGPHEYAPYIATSITLFLFLTLLTKSLGSIRPLPKLLILLYLCTIPSLTLTLTEFKPDLPWGISLTAAAYLTLTRPILTASRKHLLLLGFAWSIPFLTKPTTTPGTAALCLLCFAIRGTLLLFEKGDTATFPPPSSILRSLLLLALPPFILLAPYYLLTAPYLAYYIRHTLTGEYASTWVLPGNWLFQSLFYLTGYAGRANLGFHLYLILLISAAGWITAICHRDKPTLLIQSSLLLFTLAAYLLPTLVPAKNLLLASPFYCLLILTTAMWLSYLVSHSKTQGWQSAGLLFLLIIGAFSYHYPGRYFSPTSPEHLQSQRLHNDVLSTLRQHTQPYPQTVTITAASPVREITLDWYATLEKLPFTFLRPGSDKLPDYETYFDHSDFILAQEDHILGANPAMPNERVQSKVLDLLRHRPDYTLLTTYTAADDKKLYLFERTDYSRDFTDNHVRLLDNFLPEFPSTPYPGPTHLLLIPPPSPWLHYLLHLTAQGTSTGPKTLTLLSAAKAPLATLTLQDRTITSLTLPLTAPLPSTLTLQITRHDFSLSHRDAGLKFIHLSLESLTPAVESGTPRRR